MSRRTSSRRRALQQPTFPQLPVGVQAGLKRLVAKHADTVARMLDYQKDDKDDDTLHKVLCEKCATVMKQQQLRVAQFLARFFDLQLLQEQTAWYQKSTKGTAAVLSERIETAWLQNQAPKQSDETSDKVPPKHDTHDDNRKRSVVDGNDETAETFIDKDEAPMPKKSKTAVKND